MKFIEFRKLAERISHERHISIDEVDFTVSLWPMETKAEDFIRYFGEIHELMDYQGDVMILCDGERNST